MPYTPFGSFQGIAFGESRRTSYQELSVNILNLGEEMLLEAGSSIHSLNYASGTAGFKLNYDGTVEINDLTMLGSLKTAASGQRMEIDGTSGGQFRIYDSSDVLKMTLSLDANGFMLFAGDVLTENTASAQHAWMWRYNFADAGPQIRIKPASSTEVAIYFEDWSGTSEVLSFLATPAASGSTLDVLFDSTKTVRWKQNRIGFYVGTANELFYMDSLRFYITTNASSEKFRLIRTSAGGNYISFTDATGTTREGWLGYGGTGTAFSIRNDNASGSLDLQATDGTGTAYNRIRIYGAGDVRILDNSGTAQFYVAASYTQIDNGLRLVNSSLVLDQDATNTFLKITTPYGYAQIGPANASWCHIYTDRAGFYFNQTSLSANGNTIWHAGNDGSGSGLDADTLDGNHGSAFGQLAAVNTWTNVNKTHSIYPTAAGTYVCGTATYYWNYVQTVSIYRTNEYALSSRKLKKNIKYGNLPGLDLVMAVEPASFEWRKASRGDTYTTRWYPIAEDVHKALTELGYDPEEVALSPMIENENGKMYPGLEDTQLVAVLWKAVRELRDEVERLKQRATL